MGKFMFRVLIALVLLSTPVYAQQTVNRFVYVQMVPTAAPTNPVEGMIYQDTATHTFLIYNGTAWFPAGAGAAGTGNVVGPASATTGFLPTYADTSGKLLTSGIDPATIGTGNVVGPASAVSGVLANYNGITGKLIGSFAGDSTCSTGAIATLSAAGVGTCAVDATAAVHGLLPIRSGNAYDFFLGDGTFGRTVARGSIAASSPWSFTQTWNASGTAFDGLNLTVTRTASATASNYIRANVVGLGDVFAVRQDGANTDKVRLVVNEGQTGSSQDWSLNAIANQVALSRGDGTAVNRQFNARHIVLSGAPNAGSYPIVIGSDQFQGIQMASGRLLGWSASSTDAVTLDTAFARNAAGVIETNNGTPGTFISLVTKSVRGAAVTFANLPAAPVEGMLVAVTDSTTVVWGATITGTGANHVLAYYNGTNWTVAGK